MGAAPDPLSLIVIVPTKDRLSLLKRAIESVEAQQYRSLRTVIVDDGSTDGTGQYLDSLNDPRIRIIHHEKSRGVNAARNAAIKTLAPDEWAVMLDDDDELLPGALETVARIIVETPKNIGVLFFGTIIHTRKEQFNGGYQFASGERFHDPTYLEFFTKAGTHGDSKPVIRASVFERHLFKEDINGFESEFFNLLIRDGVGIRYVREQVMRIDQAHGAERLSDTAARRSPASFTRANVRVFRDHADLFAAHPRLAMHSAAGSLKTALRAFDISHALVFAGYWLQGSWRLTFFRHSQE